MMDENIQTGEEPTLADMEGAYDDLDGTDAMIVTALMEVVPVNGDRVVLTFDQTKDLLSYAFVTGLVVSDMAGLTDVLFGEEGDGIGGKIPVHIESDPIGGDGEGQ